jgi:ABC-type transporter Mla MlaB component
MLECTLLPATDRQPATLRVSGEAGIAFILQLKTALADALREHPDLTVDCQGVTDADFSFLQLLCSAHRTFQSLRLAPTCREALGGVMERAGLERFQGCCLVVDKNSCIWIRPASNDPPPEPVSPA